MLSDYLKNQRIDMGKTLQEMSEIIGLSANYLSLIERGKNIPKKSETLKKLADGYKLFYPRICDEMMKSVKATIKD